MVLDPAKVGNNYPDPRLTSATFAADYLTGKESAPEEPIVITGRVTPEIRRALRLSYLKGKETGMRDTLEKVGIKERMRGIFEAPILEEKKEDSMWKGIGIGLLAVLIFIIVGAIFTGKSSVANEKRLGDVIAGLRSDVTALTQASEATVKKAEVPVGGIIRGVASWYGGAFNGRKTASGKIYDMEADTVAMPDAKMIGQRVLVFNEQTGRAAIGLCTDLGPFVGERVIDTSWAIAKRIGLDKSGLAWVTVVRLGPEDKTP